MKLIIIIIFLILTFYKSNLKPMQMESKNKPKIIYSNENLSGITIHHNNGLNPFMIGATMNAIFQNNKIIIEYKSYQFDVIKQLRNEYKIKITLQGNEYKEFMKALKNTDYKEKVDGGSDSGQFFIDLIYKSGDISEFVPTNIGEWVKILDKIEKLIRMKEEINN